MRDCVMLDIGGTYVKYGCARHGELIETGQFPIRERGSREEILRPILDFLRCRPAPLTAVSIPGPMDYEEGVSLMRHKFAALYGVSLKAEIGGVFPGSKIVFVHDGVAFVLGEMARGALAGCACAAGITLGTGLGFCLCLNGKALVRPTLTPLWPMWSAPFEGGTAEDFVSGRGVRRQWLEKTGTPLDVKEIADLARAGNDSARELFLKTGALLGRLINDHLKGCLRGISEVERVAVGGQIAKSLDLMLPALSRACSIPVVPALHLEDAALRGAYAYALLGKSALSVRPEPKNDF